MIFRDDLNYLNMQEIRSLASHFSIPVYVHYENKVGKVVKTSEIERKSRLLDKIFAYIQGERNFKPVVYSSKIVSFHDFKSSYSEQDPVLYRDFKSTNKALIACLKNLTGGQFRFGALAFIEAHRLWRSGKTASLKQFAVIWLQAVKDHTKPLDEWAFIREMQNGMSRDEWKIYRQNKADKILSILLK